MQVKNRSGFKFFTGLPILSTCPKFPHKKKKTNLKKMRLKTIGLKMQPGFHACSFYSTDLTLTANCARYPRPSVFEGVAIRISNISQKFSLFKYICKGSTHLQQTRLPKQKWNRSSDDSQNCYGYIFIKATPP